MHRAVRRESVRVRLGRPEDVEAIVALVESAYRGESSRAGWTTEADLLDGQRTDAEQVAGLLAGGSSGRAALLLAEDEDGRIAGCCLVEPESAHGADAHQGVDAAHAAAGPVPDPAPGRALFGMFAVSPASQGGGIGRRLVGAAEEHARSVLGATAMGMHVIRQRDELIAWYRRLGYEPTGETAPFPYGDERFGKPLRDDLAFVVLERRLSPGSGVQS